MQYISIKSSSIDEEQIVSESNFSGKETVSKNLASITLNKNDNCIEECKEKKEKNLLVQQAAEFSNYKQCSIGDICTSSKSKKKLSNIKKINKFLCVSDILFTSLQISKKYNKNLDLMKTKSENPNLLKKNKNNSNVLRNIKNQKPKILDFNKFFNFSNSTKNHNKNKLRKKIKKKGEKNRRKQSVKHPKCYDKENLNLLKKILKRIFFFPQGTWISNFNSFSEENKIILTKMIQYIYKKTHKISDKMMFSELKYLIENPLKKRFDEQIKYIYKLFLKKKKNEYDQIQEKYEKKLTNLYPKYSKSLKQKNKSFYFWFFRHLIETSKQPIDLIMDISSERFLNKNSISKSNNWEIKKFSSLKHIIPPFRYLISIDISLKREFLKFIEQEGFKGEVFTLAKEAIDFKIDEKFRKWETFLDAKDFKFEIFKERLFDDLQKAKYKYPWTFCTIAKACENVKKDIQNHFFLKASFLKFLSIHYCKQNKSFLE